MNRRSFIASVVGALATGCDLSWREGMFNARRAALPPPLASHPLVTQAWRVLLTPVSVPVLREIREHNALLFDFVLKRTVASNGARFGRSVFETRSFFVNRA